MTKKVKAGTKLATKKVTGIKHYGESKAAKAHAFVRQPANIRKDAQALQAELAKKFKVHVNTARNWTRDFQANPIAAAA